MILGCNKWCIFGFHSVTGHRAPEAFGISWMLGMRGVPFVICNKLLSTKPEFMSIRWLEENGAPCQRIRLKGWNFQPYPHLWERGKGYRLSSTSDQWSNQLCLHGRISEKPSTKGCEELLGWLAKCIHEPGNSRDRSFCVQNPVDLTMCIPSSDYSLVSLKISVVTNW